MEQLEAIRKEFEEIAGSWNGEDDKFISGGHVYTEEDAGMANEIIEKVDELKKLINEFNGTN